MAAQIPAMTGPKALLMNSMDAAEVGCRAPSPSDNFSCVAAHELVKHGPQEFEKVVTWELDSSEFKPSAFAASGAKMGWALALNRVNFATATEDVEAYVVNARSPTQSSQNQPNLKTELRVIAVNYATNTSRNLISIQFADQVGVSTVRCASGLFLAFQTHSIVTGETTKYYLADPSDSERWATQMPQFIETLCETILNSTSTHKHLASSQPISALKPWMSTVTLFDTWLGALAKLSNRPYKKDLFIWMMCDDPSLVGMSMADAEKHISKYAFSATDKDDRWAAMFASEAMFIIKKSMQFAQRVLNHAQVQAQVQVQIQAPVHAHVQAQVQQMQHVQQPGVPIHPLQHAQQPGVQVQQHQQGQSSQAQSQQPNMFVDMM